MVALASRDDVAPLWLAALDEILPRQLDCGLDRFRAAADKEDVTDTGRRVPDQVVSQLLGDLRGEEARMRIRDLVELLMHRRQHVRMRMTQARHRRATGGVDILLAR